MQIIKKEYLIFLFLVVISMASYFVTNIILAPILIVLFLPIAYHFKQYAFVLFIAFSYFRFQEAFPFLLPFKIPKLLALTTLALVFIDVFIKEELKIKINDDNKILFLIFCYMPFNIIFSTIPSQSAGYFIAVYIKVLLMALILSIVIKEKKDFKIINYMIILSGIIISIVAIYNKINGIGLVEGTRVTISRDIGSILGDPNDLSLIILFPLAFAISAFTVQTSSLYKFFCFTAAFVIISAILATQSRGGMLAVLAIGGLFLHQKIKNKALFFILGSMISIILFLFSGIGERSVLNEDPNAAIDASAQSRLDSWTTAFYMGLQNPILGIGMDTFINNYFFYTDAWDGKYHETHSTWLKAFSEGGIIFFVLFIILVWQTFKNIRIIKNILDKNNDNFFQMIYYSLYFAIIAFIVSSTFLTQTYTWPIYIIWALSISLKNIISKK